MKQFINENFLLGNSTAIRLYREFAENQPIIDFHCHLSPSMIADDRQFMNLTQAWLEGDHYKWRAMRTNGIPEKYCTGKEPDIDKFMKWAGTVPMTLGNPLYHWTHLELARYFNIYSLLSESNAADIYNEASSLLQTADFSTRQLILKMNVRLVCTTDDPADDLQHHKRLREGFPCTVLPTWRPDNIIKTEDPVKFRAYIEKLSEVSGTVITGFADLIDALDKRHSFFHEMGGRLSDHGLERFFYSDYTLEEADKIFRKILRGENATPEENEKYRCAAMAELCRMNHKRGWTQQFHVGALRNNNSRAFRNMGPDTGWDSIGNSQDAFRTSRFLSHLDDSDSLAKTLLYNLNPSDNEMMITMAGNFNDGSEAVKVQYGAAWWFLDQKNGMEKHLRDLASLALLPRFVGMVTDSRSFLSYPRHEYFRRLLCNFVGEEVEKGLMPDDDSLLKPLIEGVCYNNARDYFGFKL
jgi:glucuronate isomerase